MSAALQLSPTVERDPYAFWRAALANQPIDPVLVETPYGPEYLAECGFYRLPKGDGFEPIAVWRNGEGDLVAKVGTGRVCEADGAWTQRVFSRCLAVSEESYRQALATGQWSDFAGASHNNAPEGFDETKALVDEWVREADKLVKAGAAKTKADADAAANLRSKLEENYKALDKDRLATTKPLRDQVDGINTKFSAVIDPAKVRSAQLLRTVIEPFLKEQKRIALEEARKAEAETGESQLRKRRGSGEEIAPSSNAGAKGRKTFLVTTWRAEIKDYAAALAALAETPEIKSCVQSICDAAARAKARVPIAGVEFISSEEAR